MNPKQPCSDLHRGLWGFEPKAHGERGHETRLERLFKSQVGQQRFSFLLCQSQDLQENWKRNTLLSVKFSVLNGVSGDCPLSFRQSILNHMHPHGPLPLAMEDSKLVTGSLLLPL